jgi:hypothetical protein
MVAHKKKRAVARVYKGCCSAGTGRQRAAARWDSAVTAGCVVAISRQPKEGLGM